MTTPRMAAHIDWAQVGEFAPEQFTGDDRAAYEDEARLIEREWETTPTEATTHVQES